MKDFKVVDLSSMEDNNRFTTAYSLSPANTNKSKSTVTTDLSSSFEERQIRINRTHGHIHKQQMLLEEKRHEQKKQFRARPRSLSRPRDRKPATSSGGTDGKSTNVTSNNSMDSSLNRAKALLEQMEQKEKNKANNSRGRTRSPPPRGRSKSRTRTRPSDTEKSMANISRHTQQSRPSQQQHVNQNQRQNRSRSLHQRQSRFREKKRNHSEDRRRWSDWDNKNEDKRRWSETEYKHSLSKSFTTISRGDRRGKGHSEKEVKRDTLGSKSTQQMRRSPPKHSSKEEYKNNHQQRDCTQVGGRDGKSSPSARQRPKSLARSKSSLSVQRQNPKSKANVRSNSMSPRHRREKHPSSLSRDKSVKNNAEMRSTAEHDSFVFIPGGLTEELPRRSVEQTSMEKLDSVPSMSRIESALTVSVLGSDESSAPFADVQKGEDDTANHIVGNNRQQSIYRRSITSQSENKPHKMLHDKLMLTKTSMLEHNSGNIHTRTADNTMRAEKKEKEYTNKESLRGWRSPRKNEPDEFRIDMTKVESALHLIRSQTPPRSRSVLRPPPDTVDSRMLRTPPPSKNAPERSTPKRQHHLQQLSHVPPPPPYNFGHSLAVLNPDPEPEWKETDYYMSPVAQYNHAQMYQSPNQQVTHASTQQMHLPGHSPDLQHQYRRTFSVKEREWTKYVVKSSARQNDPNKKERRRSKTSVTVPDKLSNHNIRTHVVVKNMPFTDNQGDSGIYSGQVNEDGRPDGKGSMKYDNGIFYEGMWTGGSQDERSVSQYDRIRGGFTSWGGKGKVAVKSGRTMPWNATKIDKNDENDTTNVRGMEWVDRNGDWGRYTGEVNKDKIPHGRGIMKYSFGLIAEGEWVCGVLKENPQDRLIAAASLASHGGASVISGVRSLGIGGGMSVGPGMSMGGRMSLGQRPPMLVGSGMSVGQGSMYGGSFSQTMMQPQQMTMMQAQPQQNTAQQHAMIAQQNSMMNGEGSVHKSQIPIAQQQMAPMQEQHLNSDQNGHAPPIFEITLG